MEYESVPYARRLRLCERRGSFWVVLDQCSGETHAHGNSKGRGKRLPSGRHALAPDLVASLQRTRLTEAMLHQVGVRGYPDTTVKDVLERAETSRRVFYSHYSSKEECYLAAYDAAVDQISAWMGAAAVAESGWRDQVRAALSTLLAFLDDRPQIGRALLVEVHSAGTEALTRRMETMNRLALSLEDSFERAEPGAAARSTITSDGIVGGIESTIRSRLREDEARPLATLLPELMYLVLLPYQGPAAAMEELPLLSAADASS